MSGVLTMSVEYKVICDACGLDITKANGNRPGWYRLCLHVEELSFGDDDHPRPMDTPPVMGTKHFCGVACLRKWLEWCNG